jgi:hypothetical protein
MRSSLTRLPSFERAESSLYFSTFLLAIIYFNKYLQIANFAHLVCFILFAMNKINDVVTYFGSQTALVHALNVKFNLNLKTAHVYYWINTRIPVNRAKQVVQVSQGAFSLFDLRPDLYE